MIFLSYIKLTVHLYGDLLSENFHARTTVVLVAHLTVKFFGTSVERKKKTTKTKQRQCISALNK